MPIETVENMLCETLHSFLDVAERFLGLIQTLHAWVSLGDVSDQNSMWIRRIGQPTVGLIMKGMIGREFRAKSFDDDPWDLLRPFFEAHLRRCRRVRASDKRLSGSACVVDADFDCR